MAQPPANTEADQLAAALAGDHDAFGAVADRYRRELHLRCDRMSGSFHDAEDAVQETFIRAWRHLATSENRSSFRAWLYRIATNVTLTQRNRAQVLTQPFPAVLSAAAMGSTEPAIRLTPYPDALLEEVTASSGDPVAETELRESVQLAFPAAVQLLPPRQRAVLILREVVGFSPEAVAEMLGSTVASVNSEDEETFVAWGIWVLTVDGDAIAEVTAFLDPTLLPVFGFPETDSRHVAVRSLVDQTREKRSRQRAVLVELFIVRRMRRVCDDVIVRMWHQFV